MKSIKNIVWGVFFLAIAAFVIVGSMGYFGDISVWTVLITGVLAVWFVSGLMRLSFGNMLFPIACAAIVYDEVLGIEKLTPWPVLVAALFGTIGLNIIFNRHKKDVFKEKKLVDVNIPWNKGDCVEEMSQDNTTFKSEVVFSSSVRYITCQKLRWGKIENVFSNTTIYLDNAQLCDGYAEIKVESVLGKTTLYIPEGWNVDLRVTKVFGGANEKGRCNNESENTLVIKGEAVFGHIEIEYI